MVTLLTRHFFIRVDFVFGTCNQVPYPGYLDGGSGTSLLVFAAALAYLPLLRGRGRTGLAAGGALALTPFDGGAGTIGAGGTGLASSSAFDGGTGTIGVGGTGLAAGGTDLSHS